jgi:hypothetical protein
MLAFAYVAIQQHALFVLAMSIREPGPVPFRLQADDLPDWYYTLPAIDQGKSYALFPATGKHWNLTLELAIDLMNPLQQIEEPGGIVFIYLSVLPAKFPRGNGHPVSLLIRPPYLTYALPTILPYRDKAKPKAPILQRHTILPGLVLIIRIPPLYKMVRYKSPNLSFCQIVI